MFGELANEWPKIVIWYLVFLILGLAGMPFLNKYFSKWKDGGYGVSKFLSMAAVTLPLWFLSALKILPFNQSTSILFFVGFVGLSIWYAVKTKFRFNRALVKWIIYEEILFTLVFVIWTFIRSTNSQVEGTEKMMNIAFMNSMYRAEYFPVADPWYYGGFINYYHLGHYMYVFIAKMTGIPISFAYNFALNTIAGFTFIGAFSIIVKLINAKGWQKGATFAGLFGATWLCFGANFYYLYKWIEAVFVKFKYFDYWFPDGTRIISNAIDEFPAYSIPLGDLHGHYLGMPFIVIMIALLIVSYNIKIGSREKIKFNLIISVLVCVLYGINSWDFITTIFLFGLLFLYQAFTSYKLWSDRLIVVFMATISLVVPGILFMIPYIVNFDPPVGGIGVVPLGQTSDILQWLQMWGMFVALTASFIFMKSLVNGDNKLRAFALTVLAIFLLVVSFGGLQSPVIVLEGFMNFKIVDNSGPVFIKLATVLMSIILFVLVFMLLFRYLKIKLEYKKGRYENLVILMTVASLALIFGVEVLFVQDIFFRSNPPYFRTNTVFKFYYHAWIIWSITSSYFVYKIFSTYLNSKEIKARIVGSVFAFMIFILYIGSVSYIFEAVKDFYPFIKYDNINYPTTEQWASADIGDHVKIYDSIDGNMYIKRYHLGDYEAMKWFNANVKGQPTVVEAIKDAYSYYQRYSANVGLINIMGWPTHEWQWRSNSVSKLDEETGKIIYEDLASKDAFDRKAEVEKIYQTTDINELKSLIAKYNVEYIIIGEKELEAYGDSINEELISQLCGKVYDNYDTKIYKVLGI